MNHDLLLVGYRTVGTVAKRAIFRIDPVAKALVWAADAFGDSAASHGAWEMVDLNHDGTTILLSGVCARPTTEEMTFKSYGNVPNGNAVAMEIPLASLTANTRSTDATWTKIWTAAGGAPRFAHPSPGNSD